MTLAGSVLAVLSSGWALTGNPLENAKFVEGWYDSKKAGYPQVTVSNLSAPAREFYGTATVRVHHQWAVNVWLQIPVGAAGANQLTQIEQMNREVFRIININRSIASLDLTISDGLGEPHHELDTQPRLLRYEQVVYGVETL